MMRNTMTLRRKLCFIGFDLFLCLILKETFVSVKKR